MSFKRLLLQKLIPFFTLGFYPKKLPQLKQIFICDKAGDAMSSIETINAVEQRGLIGDRYYEKTGYWRVIEGCQVTLITLHDITQIEQRAKQSMQTGKHRRNLVVANISIKQLKGRQFQIGTAIFQYEKPRPPCGYIEQITYKGMARALGRNSGICINVVKSGTIRLGDYLVLQ